jgi:hypothetical protein
MPPKQVHLAVPIDIGGSYDLPARIRWLVVEPGRAAHRGSVHEPDRNPANAALKENVGLAVPIKIARSNDLPG